MVAHQKTTSKKVASRASDLLRSKNASNRVR